MYIVVVLAVSKIIRRVWLDFCKTFLCRKFSDGPLGINMYQMYQSCPFLIICFGHLYKCIQVLRHSGYLVAQPLDHSWLNSVPESGRNFSEKAFLRRLFGGGFGRTRTRALNPIGFSEQPPHFAASFLLFGRPWIRAQRVRVHACSKTTLHS